MISSKGRYALRSMLDIAINGVDENVKTKDIAERQDISIKYLEQIVSILNKAGYITSKRGPQGGCRLTNPPSEYTVGMILRLIEGDIAPVSCVSDNCANSSKCTSMILWRKLDNAINDVLDSTTLADMMEWDFKGRMIEIGFPDTYQI